MQFDFKGKRVFVAFGAKGIGRATAEAFHLLGASVAIHDRDANRIARVMDALGAGDRLIPAHGALSSTAEIQPLLAGVLRRMGGLDILVNCNVGNALCPVDQIRADYWTRSLNQSLKSMFFIAQACVPALKESKGCIVNVVSSLGLIGGASGSALHAASQHGIVQMTKMMALDLSPSEVRVNALCAGWVVDERNATDDASPSPDAVCFAASTPMGRSGKPLEAAAGIVYLASELAGFTTGAVLTADGGVTAGRYVV